jgi:hypothetical protein
MDHTDGTYCAAELLRRRFDRVVVVTPRESIAQETYLVTRQAIFRRFHEQAIEVLTFSEPRWSDGFMETGTLDVANVYTGAITPIADVAFFAYATPRAPDDGIATALAERGVPVTLVGDAKVARAPMAATAEGYAAAMAI